MMAQRPICFDDGLRIGRIDGHEALAAIVFRLAAKLGTMEAGDDAMEALPKALDVQAPGSYLYPHRV
jgi:hypothetical protein